MALKAVLIFLLSHLLLTAIACSLIPTAIATRDVVNESPSLPLLRGGEGKNTDEKGCPLTDHRQPSTHKRASVRREMNDVAPLTPYPIDPYHDPPPSGRTSPTTNPCSYPPCK